MEWYQSVTQGLTKEQQEAMQLQKDNADACHKVVQGILPIFHPPGKG